MITFTIKHSTKIEYNVIQQSVQCNPISAMTDIIRDSSRKTFTTARSPLNKINGIESFPLSTKL